MAADYLSRKNGEDARVEKEVALAEAKTLAALAAKKAAAAEMRDSIDAHMKLTREKAIANARAAAREGAAAHEVFRGKLAALAEQERRDAKGRRVRATENASSALAMMADKKRTLEAWAAVEATDARKADSAALGGPLDAVFQSAATALREDMLAKDGPRGAMAVDRLVHKLTHVGFS